MNNIWNLSERELEILDLIIKGLTNPQIAEKLVITTHTVKAHIASIYFKTNIHSRVLLAISAVKLGIFNNNDVNVR